MLLPFMLGVTHLISSGLVFRIEISKALFELNYVTWGGKLVIADDFQDKSRVAKFPSK